MGGGRGKAVTGHDPLFFSRTYDFLNVYLTRQAGRSEHTRKSYRTGLGALYDHVTVELGIAPTRFTFGMCTYDLLLGWSQRMREGGLAASTVNSRMAAVRSYLRYAADGDPSLVSVWLASSKVPTLAVPRRQRPIIEADDLAAFLDAPEHTRTGNRDRFILVLLFDTAMRAAELVGVTLGDLALPVGAPASVLVHGKGRKERRIGLSERADAYLRAYLDAYHEGGRDPSTPLVYTVSHGAVHAMSERNVERIVAKYGDVARDGHPDIPHTHPHMVRYPNRDKIQTPDDRTARDLGRRPVGSLDFVSTLHSTSLPNNRTGRWFDWASTGCCQERMSSSSTCETTDTPKTT